MIALLLFIVFGLFFGYFATLNTSVVSIHLGTYTIDRAPIYLVVLVCLGLGVLFATLFYFLKSLSSQFAFSKKETELSKAHKEITELTKQAHRLELENTRLKTQNGEEDNDEESI